MSELIDEILMLHGRKIIVADSEIDLSAINMNDIFILFVEESRGSAGVELLVQDSGRSAKL